MLAHVRDLARHATGEVADRQLARGERFEDAQSLGIGERPTDDGRPLEFLLAGGEVGDLRELDCHRPAIMSQLAQSRKSRRGLACLLRAMPIRPGEAAAATRAGVAAEPLRRADMDEGLRAPDRAAHRQRRHPARGRVQIGEIRRASIYIGLLALGAFGPAVVLLLLGIARLLSDPSIAATLAANPIARIPGAARAARPAGARLRPADRRGHPPGGDLDRRAGDGHRDPGRARSRSAAPALGGDRPARARSSGACSWPGSSSAWRPPSSPW